MLLVIAWNILGAAWAQEEASAVSATELNRSMQAELEQQAALIPPETIDLQELCVFHHKRGMANLRLGRYAIAISDLKKALASNQPSRLTPDNWGDHWRIQNDLKGAFQASGDNFALLEYLNSIGIEYRQANPRRYFITRLWMVDPYIRLGMLKEAEEAFRTATDLLPQLRNRRDWSFNENNILELHGGYSAWLQEIRGNYVEAERLRRSALDNARQWSRQMERSSSAGSQLIRIAEGNVTGSTRNLASVLSVQGKLGEAEYLAHDALSRALAYSSFNSVSTSNALSALRGIKLQQGNLADAKRYAQLALQAIETTDVQQASWTLADRRGQLGFIQVMQEHYPDALRSYDIRDQGLRSNPEQFAKRGSADLNWGLALLRTGQGERAVKMLQGNLNFNLKKAFVDPLYVAHIRGYLAVALTELGADTEALAQVNESLPVLLKRAREAANDNDSGFVNTYRLQIIVEGYLELLARRHAAGQTVAGLDLAGESFKLADIARNSSVQRAVTSSAARASLPDLQLAQLARKEQDTSNQIQALGKVLARLSSASEEKRLQKVIDEMQRDSVRLSQEQTALRKEILEKFPDYAALIDPQPATPADVQKRLRSDEAVISLYSGERQTYVWTITPTAIRFRAVALTRANIQRDVGKILASVDLTNDHRRAFETQGSQQLYARLLAPDAGLWAGTRLINVIPHGALGQLPFALLLTDPANAERAGKPSTPVNYRDLPWLINKVAIAQQSSASGFLALRQTTPAIGERLPFVGFGDPLFIADATAGSQRGKQVRSLSIGAAPDEMLQLLERAQGKDQAFDRQAMQNRPTLAQAFTLLPPLPDTAEELKEIAATTGGNAGALYLGDRATESNVKTTDLSRYKVLAFATHGLVPGDINGLDQPALALSNPALTREANNDGFLTLEEVLGLKLNADWVILSACNTASDDGQAKEAVSGLGRAFFYAGTRSLLVSNWAVETVSARLLTTGLFRQHSADPGSTRAEALRRSMLAVMKNTTADYSHPAFWAPFALVGDGAAR